MVVVHRVELGIRGLARGHGGACPLQRAVGGGDRGVQEFRDLVRFPSQHVTQDQHGPLPGRQVLECGHERQSYGLPRDGHLGWVATSGTTRASGIGSIHATSEAAIRVTPGPAETTARVPSAAPAAADQPACRGTRSWRSGRATSATRSARRTGRSTATRAPSCPAQRPRRRTPTRACGSSSRSALAGTPRADRRPGCRRDRRQRCRPDLGRRWSCDLTLLDNGDPAAPPLPTLRPCADGARSLGPTSGSLRGGLRSAR